MCSMICSSLVLQSGVHIAPIWPKLRSHSDLQKQSMYVALFGTGTAGSEHSMIASKNTVQFRTQFGSHASLMKGGAVYGSALAVFKIAARIEKTMESRMMEICCSQSSLELRSNVCAGCTGEGKGYGVNLWSRSRSSLLFTGHHTKPKGSRYAIGTGLDPTLQSWYGSVRTVSGASN